MLFNSIDFAIFLPIVFFVYWFILNKNIKLQNFLIVLASYIFYGCWNWKFLSLIMISTIVDFSIGLKLGKIYCRKKRKILLLISILVNLGFLGFFKYYNFFIENFASAFSLFGTKYNIQSLNIILPVGISFYTFQTLSYTIDVYNRKLNPTKDFIAFSAFVCFFPQLVAGPIERATNLLPQFFKQREFNHHKAVDGMRQILWGFVKKIVIADNCAEYVNYIFKNYENCSSNVLFLGAFLFAFQIYGDFSGYSDIAIGTSRLFGFSLMQNFAFPYFSRDIAEFWRRWHISLSTWFRDYLYIPLGGSRGGLLKSLRNTFIIFLVSGFWHGANWTFIVWGGINALYFLPLLLISKNRSNIEVIAKGKKIPSLKEIVMMTSTFLLTTFAWIFFRAESVKHALSYIKNMFLRLKDSSNLLFDKEYLGILSFVFVFIIIEWFGRENDYAIQFKGENNSFFVRWSTYLVLTFVTAFYFGQGSTFIYFQF